MHGSAFSFIVLVGKIKILAHKIVGTKFDNLLFWITILVNIHQILKANMDVGIELFVFLGL